MRHRLLIDGTAHEAWLLESEGRWVLFESDARRQIQDIPGAVVAVDGDVAHIHLDGRAYAVAWQSPSEHFGVGAAADAEHVLRAPMPGAVVALEASPGDAVKAGQTLLVIESMKLETAIKAGRDAVVEAVHVGLGQTFEREAVLVTLAQRED